ncbi:lipopolysaccharide biosynthesis protein [Aliagarivorans marinus]|uniref:lipopolysaccharide biosynthesis protein n=1 Tax=Aliagarivorans marinus TaxID=561965 RepID=UPI000419C935|nr:oligosaccharide flippase family protein [Aliagarivorans marinus]
MSLTLLSRLSQHSLLRSLRVLISGNAVAQLLSVLVAPLLTRLYSPDDFGMLALFMSASAIAAIPISLQLESAIPLPKRQIQAARIFAASISVAAISTLILCIALGGYALYSHLVGTQPHYPLYVFALAIIYGYVLSAERASQYWLLRSDRIKLIALGAVIAVFCSASFRLVSGGLAPSGLTLIVGAFVGTGAALIAYVKSGALSTATCHWQRFSLSAWPTLITRVCREYHEFPKFQVPQRLLNTANKHAPAIVLMGLFGPAIAGFYALAERIVHLPGRLVSEATRKAFYRHAVKKTHDEQPIARTQLLATGVLALVGFVPFTTLFFCSPWLFKFAFGETWVQAGQYASWLAIWIYAVFVNTPSVALIPILRKQKRYLLLNIVGSTTRVTSMLIAALFFSAETTVVTFSIAGLCYNLIVIADVYRQVCRYDQQLQR